MHDVFFWSGGPTINCTQMVIAATSTNPNMFSPRIIYKA
jgi:hypothetical protein